MSGTCRMYRTQGVRRGGNYINGQMWVGSRLQIYVDEWGTLAVHWTGPTGRLPAPLTA